VQSALFVKKLLAVAVSNIAYLRAIFPENAFGDRSLEGIFWTYSFYSYYWNKLKNIDWFKIYNIQIKFLDMIGFSMLWNIRKINKIGSVTFPKC